MVRPYVAFSMLQPGMIAPSAVSSAAPTLKCENSACAFRRTLRAAARRSESLNDPLQQSNEGASYAPRRFHDLVVHERLRENTGRHVRDAGDAQYLDPHVAGGNRFRHSRHANGVGADGPEEANLGRRLVARTMHPHVDT